MKYQPKFTLTFLLITSVFFVKAQDGYFKVREVKRDSSSLSFPIFSRIGDSSTVKNINQLLQLQELQLLYGYQKDNIFENISKLDTTHGLIIGISMLSCNVLANTPRTLSIKVNKSVSMPTTNYWVKYYNFNSGNGNLIQLKDLFKPEDFAFIKQMILEKRRAVFKNALQNVDKERQPYLMDILDCYQVDSLQDYYIQDTTIVIDGENCVSKNQKIFDLNIIAQFNLSEFKSYLNAYGRAVFGLTTDNMAKYHSFGLSQLFDGTIGNIPITIIINHDYYNYDFSEGIRGEYIYRKYGQGIILEGTLNNNKLTLTEKTPDYKDNGYINATFDGKEINGTWTDSTKTKTLKLIAKRR